MPMKRKIKRPRYSEDEINRVKDMYVNRQMAKREISKQLNGRPSDTQIARWARRRNTRTGKTWDDERKERAEAKYLELSPQAIASQFMRKLNQLLQDDGIPCEACGRKGLDAGRFADAAYKTVATMEKVLDPSLQFPVMFVMLEDFLKFARSQQPDVFRKNGKQLTGEQIVQLIRDFKNHIRARLNLDLS